MFDIHKWKKDSLSMIIVKHEDNAFSLLLMLYVVWFDLPQSVWVLFISV